MTDNLKIWTDGSCDLARKPGDKGTGAWAYTLRLGDDYIDESGAVEHTTCNRMEMSAVLQALTFVLHNPDCHTFKSVTILTDSKYTIGAFTKWRLKPKTKNTDLIIQYKNLETQLSDAGLLVYMQWVRGHDGDPGNEHADHLAETARIQHKRNQS